MVRTVAIALSSVLVISTAAVGAGNPPAASTLGAVRIALEPTRDESDQDSVVITWDFEDGWGDWTHTDLTDVGDKWHISEFNAYEEGQSWWCGDEELGGYDNHWLQHLLTPVLDFSQYDEVTLRFMVYWSVENPDVGQPPPDPYDAWDGCNVWISSDGGRNWSVAQPTRPQYTHRSLYSFGEEWGMGANIPGWCASSGEWPRGQWVAAEFNLNALAGQDDAVIRWTFCSDPGWATGDQGDENRQAIGYLVDNIEILGDGEVIWSNDAEEVGDMRVDNEQEQAAGDYWEITDADAHSGRHSAHCRIEPGLQAALNSPVFEVPGAEYYTYFDFWVRCDTRMYDSNNDNLLDDYFSVWVTDNGVTWTRMVYDYAANTEQHRHHPNWLDDFGYYGPDTAFQRPPNWPVEEWQWKLNLSRFAGREVQLRWVFHTDEVMDNPQGSGLYIDDVSLKISERAANDVGVDWVHIARPATLGASTFSRIKVTNYGMSEQAAVRKYYRIDAGQANAIGNPSRLGSDSSEVVTFLLAMGATYADSVSVTGFTALDGDANEANDAYTVNNVVIYPRNIYVLGYDQWNYRYYFNFENGNGPAVRFTPSDDRVRGNYDLEALRVRWNGAQNVDVEVDLHIFAETNGRPGREIYGTRVRVTRNDLLPNVQVIDLSDVADLQNRSGNFWVWFELLRDDGWPAIIGDAPEVVQGVGHYFGFDGQNLTQMNADEFQIQAVLMPANTSGRELIPGRERVDFGFVPVQADSVMRVALFNGGTQTVTISDFNVEGEGYQAEFRVGLPITLRIGDMAHLFVTFTPTEEREYQGRITFTTDDRTPPEIPLIGTASRMAVRDNVQSAPAEFRLGRAQPNPFNSRVVIPYALPVSAEVGLAIYDLSGRRVAQLVRGVQAAGNHTAVWEAGNEPAGVYIYRLKADGFRAEGKMVLMK